MTGRSMMRPDNRPPAVVWRYFKEAFGAGTYPNVSWALGSDWGFGTGTLSAEAYRTRATELMVAVYGADPT